MTGRSTALDALREDGYVVLPGVLGSAEVEAMRSALAPYLEGRLFGRNDFEGTRSERVYALLAKDATLARLVEDPEILALVDELLPAHYLLSAFLAINVHPGETAQAFHVDDAAGGFPMPPPRPHQGVSVIWALEDFTPDNGATEVVPGSHRFGPAQLSPTDAQAVQVVMSAGSAVVFLGNLQHRGGAHRGSPHDSLTRLGVTTQYCAPWMRQIENMVLAVPPMQVRELSSRVQSLLGYSVVLPGFMGYVDGVHPRRLLELDRQD